MGKLTIEKVEYEVEDAVEKFVTDLQQRFEAANDGFHALEDRARELEGQVRELEGKLKAKVEKTAGILKADVLKAIQEVSATAESFAHKMHLEQLIKKLGL